MGLESTYWDWNPVKIHSFPNEIRHLVSELSEAHLAYHIKNSVRDRVIGKKWVYLEKK